MMITIKAEKVTPFKRVTNIDDGKNALTITTDRTQMALTITTIESNGDSIFSIKDLLEVLEAVG